MCLPSKSIIAIHTCFALVAFLFGSFTSLPFFLWMSVERHLLKETLVHVPFLGITLVHVVWDMMLCFGISLIVPISCNLPGVCGPCVLRREKRVSYNSISSFIFNSLLQTQLFKRMQLNIRCYTVCTHNRIRSPRLAAFGRIETRWVREVGKFGPYLRYKDWLRRRLLDLMALLCFAPVFIAREP